MNSLKMLFSCLKNIVAMASILANLEAENKQLQRIFLCVDFILKSEKAVIPIIFAAGNLFGFEKV
jgi:hypothetical protein